MPHQRELHKYMSAVKLKELGIKLYKGQKYSEAVEVFNASLKSASDADQAEILGYRSIAHEKSGNLNAALRDGRTLLKADPTSARAYLLVSRLLCSRGRDDLAAQICARGLARCDSVSDGNYQKLKSMASRDRPVVLVDPFSKLPPELLEAIFALLPLESICRALRVSKTWAKGLTNIHSIWYMLDFCECCRTPKLSTISKYIAYAGGNTRSLSLSGRPYRLLDETVLQLFSRCQKLRHIRLDNIGLRSSFFNSTSWNWDEIRVLRLTGRTDITFMTMQILLDRLLNLEIADFEAVILQSRKEDGWSLLLGSTALRVLKLKIFRLDSVRDRVDDSPRECLTITSSTESPLHELHVDFKIHARFSFELNNAKRLKHLRVLDSADISTQSLHRVLSLPGSLESLYMKNVDCILGSPTAVQTEFDQKHCYLPKLRYIKVYNAFFYLHESSIGAVTSTATLEAMRHILNLVDSPDVMLFAEVALHYNSLATRIMDMSSLVDSLLSGRIKNVDSLSIEMCDREVNGDEIASVIAANMRSLREVGLLGTSITGIGVKTLVQSLTRLKRMNLDYCDMVGPDAIVWARSQGIDVKQKLIRKGTWGMRS